jgi:SNF2 family DNA or RNA helicase
VNEVRVEKVGERILISSEGRLAGVASSIPGAYPRKDGLWSVALDLENCLLLRERYGKRLLIGPALTAWARAEKEHRAGMKATAASLDAELSYLPRMAPKLAKAMDSRTYQKSGVRFIVDAKGRDGRRRCLLADTVGLGKTAQALGACLESQVPGPYLIIAPKTSVNLTWKAEINRWLPEDEVITIPDGRAAREEILDRLLMQNRAQRARGFHQDLELTRTWVVIHPAAIRTQTWWDCGECGSPTKYTRRPTPQLDCGHMKNRKTAVRHDHTFPQLFAMDWGGIVVDEAHDVLIMKSGTPNLQRTGADLLAALVRPGGVRLAMSGTPNRSKPHQAWSTLNWLDPVRYSGKWRYLEKYWDVSQSGYGGSYTLGEFREEREEMMYAELADIMLRREREQVRGDLPAKDYPSNVDPEESGLPKGIWLEMTPAQAKAYNQMAKEAEATLEGGTLSPVGILAEMTRLKQFACSTGIMIGTEYLPTAGGNKYEWLVGFMRQLGFPDEPATKLVFASQFTKLLKAFGPALEAEFKIKVGYITGEETQARRDANIASFEDPDSDLNMLLINTKAGGSSITLDAADIMVIDDETPVDDEQEQLEGRIDNRNPERKIVPRSYYYLRSLGTIEEQIAVKNAEAKAAGKRLMDGVKPADFARAILTGETRISFQGGPSRKIRRCRECGVSRNQYHIGDCDWDGE